MDERLPYPGGEDNSLLYEITEFLEGAGADKGTELEKIFCSPPFVLHLARILFLLTIVSVSKMEYCEVTGGLVGKKGIELDGIPFVMGIATILRQFNPVIARQYLIHVTQFIKSFIIISVVKEQKTSEIPMEAKLLAIYLKQFFKCYGDSFADIRAQIPEAFAS